MRPREIFLLGIVLIGLVVAAVGWFQSRSSDAFATQSARNLRQWGISLNLFLIDNQNQLPETGGDPVSESQNLAWYNALPQYLGRSPLSALAPGERPKPGVESMWIIPGSREPKAWDPNVFFFNYAMNQFLQPEAGVRSYRINELGYPANVVFMTEVNGYSPTVTPETVDTRFGPGGMSPRAFANVLFCDGHVEPAFRSILVDDPASLRTDRAKDGLSWFKE